MINKKNYTSNIIGFNNLINKIIKKNREKIFQIFEEHIEYNKKSKILDVGTTPILEPHENMIFYQYRFKNQITGFSNQNCDILKKRFRKNKFLIGNAKSMRIKNSSYDIVHCSATIEHVGSFVNQTKLVSELFRVAKKYVFITTPNRNFPIELHTRIPLIHLLPIKIFRWILKLFNLTFFSKEENLNLLNTKDLLKICKKNKIKNFKIFYNKLFFLNSNIILILKK